MKILSVILLFCTTAFSQAVGVKDSTLKVQIIAPARATNRNIVVDGNLKPDSLCVGCTVLSPGLPTDSIRAAKADIDAAKAGIDSARKGTETNWQTTTVKIKDANVTTAKLKDANVTLPKLSTDLQEVLDSLRTPITPEMILIKQYVNTLDFAFMAHWTGISFTNGSSSTQLPFEVVDAVGDKLQMYVEPTRNAHRWFNSATDATDLQSVGGRYGYFFDVLSRYFARGSKEWTNYCTGVFTIVLRINPEVNDAVAGMFLTSRDSASGTGFFVRRTDNNRIVVYGEAGSGNVIFRDTTTAIAHADSGWIPIVISGNGTTLRVKVGNQVSETSSITPRTAVASSFEVTLGGVQQNQTERGLISDCFIWKEFLDSAATAPFVNLSGGVFNTVSGAITESYSGSWIPSTQKTWFDYWFDFASASTLFEDQAGTDACESGDSIKYVSNKTLTYMTKFMRSIGAPVFSGTQNSLTASTWAATNVMKIVPDSIQSDYPAATIFIAFKAASGISAFQALMSTDTIVTNKLDISPSPSGQGFLADNQQAVVFNSATYLKSNNINLLGSHVRRDVWNVVMLRKRGQSWAISVNGEGLVTTTTSGVRFMLRKFGHASGGLVGQVGEVLISPHELTNAQTNLVFTYLGSRWNVIVQELNAAEDATRVTVYDNRNDPEHSYNSFPQAIIRSGVIHAVWVSQDNHNAQPDANDYIAYARLDVNGILLSPVDTTFWLPIPPLHIGAAPLAFKNTTGDDLVCGLTRFNGSTTVTSYTKTRIAGVFSSETAIVNPVAGASKFAITHLEVVGTTWYALGYNTSPKFLSLIKSTNSGVSWDSVLTMRSGSYGGKQFEEPKMLKLLNGSYLISIREDISPFTIYTISSSDINSWGALPTLTTVGQGAAMPAMCQLSDGTIFLSTRGAFGATMTNESWYYNSNDNGTSWVFGAEYDSYRRLNAGWIYEYGVPLNLENDNVGFLWSGESGSQGAVANISFRRL